MSARSERAPGPRERRPTAWLPRARRHWADWWDRRHPATDHLRLTQRNVYILPTRAGWVFGGTLAVLLVASINYQLSLGYLLTFLLAGSAIVSMHVTHATLRGLALHLRPATPVFTGESWAVDCVLVDPLKPARQGLPGLRWLVRTRHARHGIGLHWRGQPQAAVWTDVEVGGQTSVQLTLAAERRGEQRLPGVTVETRFPLGLFRAWAEWRPASPVLAWPRPEQPAPPLPPARALVGNAAQGREDSEPDGVRAYRRGDAARRVLWKKAARGIEQGELVVRDSSGSGRRELWLDASGMALAGHEARLSRLCAWLLECEHRGIAWGLRLPGTELAPAQGDQHRRAGLDALARSAA